MQLVKKVITLCHGENIYMSIGVKIRIRLQLLAIAASTSAYHF